MVNAVLEVARFLNQPPFLQEVERHFAEYCDVCSDGVKRVCSTGFLSMAFSARITPQFLNGVQVLHCVEMCLAGHSRKSPAKSNKIPGLLLENFLECICSLSVEIFPSVHALQRAELIMFQLDQSTQCLTRPGPIPMQPRFESPQDQPVKRLQRQSVTQQRQLLERPATEPSRRASTPTSFMLSNSLLSTTSRPSTAASRADSSEGKQVWHTRQRVGSLVGTPTPLVISGHDEQHTSSEPDMFITRMERDLTYRAEKMKRLRREADGVIRAKALGQSRTRSFSSVTTASTVAEQASISERLYSSRKVYFERNKEKFRALKMQDLSTGQPLFRPALVAKPERHGKIDNAADVELKSSDRFEVLYRKAMDTHHRHLEQRAHEDLLSKQAANAPKITERSRYYFESRLLRDLSDAYIHTNDDSALAMPAPQCRLLLRHILGFGDRETATGAKDIDKGNASSHRAARNNVFIDELIAFLDPNNSGTVTFGRYMAFVKTIVQLNPYKKKENEKEDADAFIIHSDSTKGNVEEEVRSDAGDSISTGSFVDAHNDNNDNVQVPSSNLFAQFRQLYLAQRCYSNQNLKSKMRSNDLQYGIGQHSFTPKICRKSRRIDLERAERDQEVDVRRELQLLRRAEVTHETLERRRAESQHQELDGCTFTPEISKWRPEIVLAKTRETQAAQDIKDAQKAHGAQGVQGAAQKTDVSQKEEEEQKDNIEAHSTMSGISNSSSDGGKAKRKSAAQTLVCTGSVETPSYMRATKQSNNLIRNQVASNKLQRTQTHKCTTETKPGVKLGSDSTSKYSVNEWTNNYEYRTTRITKAPKTTTATKVTKTSSKINSFEKQDDDYEKIIPFSNIYGNLEDSMLESSEEEEDRVILFVDVELAHGVHRIEVYQNENPAKVAARFCAIHQLNSTMERRLYDHLHELIAEFHACNEVH